MVMSTSPTLSILQIPHALEALFQFLIEGLLFRFKKRWEAREPFIEQRGIDQASVVAASEISRSIRVTLTK